MAQKIAILGDGNVGQALAEGLHKAGYQIRFGSTDPAQPVKEAAEWGDLVILAVPWKAMAEVADEVGSAADGKTVVDVSNPVASLSELALGFVTSAGEEVQKLFPRAKIVKAFNTVFAQHMRTGHIDGQSITTYIASDHDDSKQQVMKIAKDIGFDAVDAGPLKSARYLEPEAMLHIFLAYGMEKGPTFGERIVWS